MILDIKAQTWSRLKDPPKRSTKVSFIPKTYRRPYARVNTSFPLRRSASSVSSVKSVVQSAIFNLAAFAGR